MMLPRKNGANSKVGPVNMYPVAGLAIAPHEPTMLQSYVCAASGSAASIRPRTESRSIVFIASSSVERQLVQPRIGRQVGLGDGDVDVVGVAGEIDAAAQRTGVAVRAAVAVGAGDGADLPFRRRAGVEFHEVRHHRAGGGRVVG